MRLAIIMAMGSGKGGVGKSTLSAGIGAALARAGERVLLIDCDAGLRSLDIMLGVTEQLVFDLSDVAEERCDPTEAIYECPACPGLSVVAATPLRPLRPDVCCAVTEELALGFDRVIMDAPAGIGSGFASAIAPAGSALIVATPDAVSVRSGTAVRRAMARTGLTDCRLILNRFSAAQFDGDDSFRDLDEVIDRTGIQLIGVVPEDRAVPMMASHGVPFLQRSPASQACARIAGRIRGERIPLPQLDRFGY